MASENDAGEDLALRRRRLRWRAWHRGTRELDLLLGPFSDTQAAAMSGEELRNFEDLLGEEDTDLQSWLLETTPAPEQHLDLINTIRAFRTRNTATP